MTFMSGGKLVGFKTYDFLKVKLVHFKTYDFLKVKLVGFNFLKVKLVEKKSWKKTRREKFVENKLKVVEIKSWIKQFENVSPSKILSYAECFR